MKKLEFIWISNLELSDLYALQEMWGAMIAEDNNNGFLLERNANDYYFKQLVNDVNAGLKYLLVVKDEDRKYVGQMVVSLFHQDTYSHRADVSSLMLLKSARSAEASLKVADCLIEICERLGLELITIDVRQNSGQEKLWRYLGFEVYGKMPLYSKVDDKCYAGVFLFQKVKNMKNVLRRRLESLYVKDKSTSI